MDVTGRLYRADQVRELDRRAIEDCGIPGYTLMQRAGGAVFRVLRARWPEASRVLVCCGGGNNGGDGYVVARLAHEAGLEVRVIALKAPDQLGGDARKAADDWHAAGGTVEEWSGKLPAADVVVDALLGTGLDREVRGDYADAIAAMAAIGDSGAATIAVDVPSGINADTGAVMGCAVRAAATASFIGRKRGLETGDAVDFRGTLLFDDLDVPESVHENLESDARRLDARETTGWAQRRPSTHKGALGHVLVVGGDFNFPGACLLAARAALVAGSGLVSVATRRAHAHSLAVGLPEAMWADGEDGATLEALIGRADVLALGPGLGASEWSEAVFTRVLAAGKSVVLDADGLNALARSAGVRERGDWILTPHPGEAARLLGCSAADIQRDRFEAVRAIAARFDAVVVLKGAGSLVADPAGNTRVCPYGNPAMATAGMGDVLTGIVASLAGQGMSLFDAACAGVVLHARAGDTAAAGRRSILAGELIDALPRVLP
ncbi:MAG: NAD(P)H-hydrate dehydratase [Wenzhouxiangellaceae bacterium]|nr:NAD(P)H-hydrate dehydratase [Wenzhouxiangellaceae bacterium]